jgi:hypothetical protein
VEAADTAGSPGGGDATASGSSISSSGKSGSCSSNGETDKSPKAAGTDAADPATSAGIPDTVGTTADAPNDPVVTGGTVVVDALSVSAVAGGTVVVVALSVPAVAGGIVVVDALSVPAVAGGTVDEPDVSPAAICDAPSVVPAGAVGAIGNMLADVRDIDGAAGNVLMGDPPRVGTLAVDVPNVSLAAAICDALNVLPAGAVGATGDVPADVRDIAGAAADVLTGDPPRVGTLAVDVPNVSPAAAICAALNVVPRGAVGATGEVPADVRDIEGAAGDVLTGDPPRVGTLAVDEPNVFPAGEVLADVRDTGGAAVDVPAGIPGRVGTVAVATPKLAAVDLLTDAAEVAEPSDAPGTAPP